MDPTTLLDIERARTDFARRAKQVEAGRPQTMPEITTPDPIWRCFYCDEVFTDRECARTHFGPGVMDIPLCQIKASEEGLAGALRKANEQLSRFYAEDSDTARAMMVLQTEHAQELKRAEEQGYARGLKDHRIASDDRQAYILKLAREMWGPGTLDPLERGARVVEEALELGQAIRVPKDMAQRILDRVYSRPEGAVTQEIGGVSVTLHALCEVVGVSLHELLLREIVRFENLDKDKARAKHAEKIAAGTSSA